MLGLAGLSFLQNPLLQQIGKEREYCNLPIFYYLRDYSAGIHVNLVSPDLHRIAIDPTAGFWLILAVVTSYSQPCHGQVTILPWSGPCPSGPPRCRQVLLMA